ncbi:MAG: prolipoprotein diacylglyceryl transferase [Planctomycetes bacterium]|nr:prolipoprotein diacylglyceryl transferase [Planctomycetota bacterium]MCH8212374.1 prolipoprotein diacylglyceryl transferase [Planctomycetota bacterium]
MSILLAEAYLHQLDPFVIEFPASWQNAPFVPDGIRWYGLSYVAGFILAWLFFRWMAVTKRSTLPTAAAAADLLFYIILGVLVGGRLGYVLFYQPSLLVEFTGHFPYWGLLAINTGGMASHGGMIGVILACWLYAHSRRLSSLHLCDLTVLAAPAGLGLGRLANFVNAELWGKALPTSMQSYPPILPAVQPPWWSVKYPEEILQWNPAVEIDMDRLLEIDHLKSSLGGDTSFYQNVVEAVRQGDQAVIGVVEPLLTAYYPSQIIQAITDGPILVATLALLWLRPRKPGVIGAVFLISYGVMRIVTERYRQPDEGVALLLGALSRGQVLSILMVVAGIAALILCQRRNVERISGLLRQPAES